MGERRLRVSVATLARVIFPHPEGGGRTLVLERKATLTTREPELLARVKAQPFGGAVRLRDLAPLQKLIGSVRFDSPRSEAERDFRLLVDPARWPLVRDFCLRHLARPDDPVLETRPDRELAEEFRETLGVELTPEMYTVRPRATLMENQPARTENVHAAGVPTVRVYKIFKVRLLDETLMEAVLENSARITDADLRRRVLDDVAAGGPGRANAALALPLGWLTERYLALPPEKRADIVKVGAHLLDGNVSCVLEGVPVPKYQVRS